MNNRLKQALGVSAVFTLSISTFLFPLQMFSALINHTGLLKALVDTIVCAALLYGFIAAAMYEFYRFIDERNRIEMEEKSRREKALEDADKQEPLPPR